MELLYSKIQNPLEDESAMYKVFLSYSKSTNGRHFYNELLNIKRGTEINNEKAFDKFYVFMYLNWRRRLMHHGSEKFVDIFPNNNFPDLIHYLKYTPIPGTKEEVDDIMRGKYMPYNDNPYVGRSIYTLKSNRWDRENKTGKWYSCVSADVYSYKYKFMDKEHILFVNISENQIYNFAKVFVEKCDEKKLPYDFKFALVEQRDDGFQIYTDSEHLVDFINIVEEIKEKYPTLINVNKDAPLLTGEISKGLSYGTYNKEHGELSYQDYFQLRCNIVASSINSTIVDYIRKNKNRSLEYHGMKMPLYEYLALKAKDKYIENLKSKYIKLAATTSDEEASISLGYTLEKLSSVTFTANVYSRMMMLLDRNLDIIKRSKGEFKDDDIESPLYICDVLKALSPYIYQIDKNYRQEFKDHMYYESLNNLINRFNFSISSDASGIENIMYKTNDEIGMYR